VRGLVFEEENACAGIVQDVANGRPAQRGVNGDVDDARHLAAGVGQRPFGRVAGKDGGLVALAKTERVKAGGDVLGAPQHIGGRDLPPLAFPFVVESVGPVEFTSRLAKKLGERAGFVGQKRRAAALRNACEALRFGRDAFHHFSDNPPRKTFRTSSATGASR
jgi:hypothetical protein